MKKLVVLTLALLLLLSTASASGGRFDASGCDTVTNEDGSVSLLGIPGEPVPVTWGEFAPRFHQSLEDNGFMGEFAFAPPVFSDGLWVRLMILDDILYVRVVTTTDGDDGLVVALSAASGKEDDALSEYVKYLTACLFEAAARVEGTFGETTMSLMHMDPAFDARKFSLDNAYWYQNGFTLYLGVHNDLYTVGRIEYGGEYAKTPVAGLVGNPVLEPPIAEGACDIDAFLRRATPYYKMIFGAEPTKEASEVINGRRMLVYSSGGIYVTLYLNGEGEDSSIGHVMIADVEGYPPNVYIAGQIALYALSGMPEDAMNACGVINGEKSTWDELSELLPCAAYNGVYYCCVNMELSAEDVTPMAVLFGEQEGVTTP